MSILEALLLFSAIAISLVIILTAIGWLIERLRDRLHPERRQPVSFNRYRQPKVYDQDEK